MWDTVSLRRQLDPRINWREAIRRHRQSLWMSRPTYANWLGVGVMSIKRWETGINEPCRVSRSLLRAKGIV